MRIGQAITHAGTMLLAVAVFAGCGGDNLPNADPGPVESATTSPADNGTNDTGTRSGTFASATEQEGYTIDMSYEISGLDVSVDIASAKPGEASIVPRAESGTFTITNTTAGRNTEILLGRPTVGFMWKASSVPGEVVTALRNADDDHCTFEFRSELYCTLARVSFESMSEVNVLDPGGQVSLRTQPAPSDSTARRYFGSYDIAETSAEPLAAFVRMTAPDLVWVNSDSGLAGGPGATWSCATRSASIGGRSAAASGYLAILAGSGEALVEGGGLKSYAGDAGESCSAA